LGLLVVLAGAPALADTDETTAGVNPATVGMQPLRGEIPAATPAPGESRLAKRADGTFGAIPESRRARCAVDATARAYRNGQNL